MTSRRARSPSTFPATGSSSRGPSGRDRGVRTRRHPVDGSSSGAGFLRRARLTRDSRASRPRRPRAPQRRGRRHKPYPEWTRGGTVIEIDERVREGGGSVIDYYTAKSLGGNTRKVSIMLAETQLDHVVHFVDLA